MAISIDCPQCQQSYSLKDGHAGKKFKCKTCGHIISVPASEESWDGLDDLEGGELVQERTVVRQLAGQRFNAPKKSKQSRSAPGIAGVPIPVVMAIVFEVLLIGINLLNAFEGVRTGQQSALVIATLRILLEGTAIAGYLTGNGVARMVSMWLCVLGTILLMTCSVFVLSSPDLLPEGVRGQVPEGFLWLIVLTLWGQVALFIGIIVCLMLPSAAEFFE